MARIRSMKDVAILQAISDGYIATDSGAIIKPDGSRQREWNDRLGYLIFRLRIHASGEWVTVFSHRFAAAYFFGEPALRADLIRHKDNSKTNNSRDNITPGTHSENRQDIAPEVRRAVMAKASAARDMTLVIAAISRANRKLTDEQESEALRLRSETSLGYREIGAIFGVSHRCAISAVSRAADRASARPAKD